MTAGSADVVICGSGVAGLAAACALGRLGLDILVLDKRPRQPPVPKGEVLQPGSLEIMHGWGALEVFEAEQPVRLNRLVARLPDGVELLPMDFGVLGCDRPWMLAHDYTTILESLARSLSSTVRVLRGVQVHDLISDSGRVVGVRATSDGREHEIRAPLVVAADGMSSRLRRAAGMAAEPVAYDHRLVTLELSGVPPVTDEVSVYVTDLGLVMVYSLPHQRIRVYVQATVDEFRKPDPAWLQRWCRELVERVPALDPLAGTLREGLDRRQLLKVWQYRAPSLVRPGIVLVGEAAHGVHPLTAQGMNTAIGDADVLASELVAAGNTDDALRGYEASRSARIRDIHVMSHNAARMMTSTSRGGQILGRRLLGGTAKSQRLRYLTTYNMSGLGMRPLTWLDRLFQFGVLPARWAPPIPLSK